MSIEYLQYIASVSHINRRDKKGKRRKDSLNEVLESSKNLGKSFRYNLPNYNMSRLSLLQNKKSILVGESDSEILSMLKLYLNSLGYDYDAVRTGDAVLDYVFNNKSSKKKYDVILLDTHLDKISGLTVANEIRKRHSHQRIMIMSTTPKEHLPYELIKSAKVHDADLFTKPFRLAELLYSIER